MFRKLNKFIYRSWARITDPWVRGGNLERLFNTGNQAESGETVSRRTIWTVPALVQGIELIASKVAQQKIHVYRRASDGSRERFRNHPAEKLIALRPSKLHTPAQFFFTLVAHAVWSGNGYAYIRRVGSKPVSLVILDPDCVTPVIDYVVDPGGETLSYVYNAPNVAGPGVVISDYEMIHLRGKGWEDNGYVGTSLVERAKEAIGLAQASIKMASRYYRRNGDIGSVVIECAEKDSFGGPKGIEQQQQLIESVKQAFDNSGVVVMAGGRKLVRQPVTAEESQFLQSREASRVDMASLLGLPANKLNVNLGTSYSSLEMNERAVLSDCYGWWLTKLEQELSLKLLDTSEFESGNVYIEFGRDNLIAMTEKETMEVDREKLNNGMMSERQFAEKYNLPFDRDLKDGWRIGNWKYQTVMPGEEEEVAELEIIPPPGLPAPEQETPEPTEEEQTNQEEENE